MVVVRDDLEAAAWLYSGRRRQPAKLVTSDSRHGHDWHAHAFSSLQSVQPNADEDSKEGIVTKFTAIALVIKLNSVPPMLMSSSLEQRRIVEENR